MGDVVSLADVRAAREPESEPAAQGRLLVRLTHRPGAVVRLDARGNVALMLDDRRGYALTAQDALDIATALIAAVKGGPNHVA